MTEPLYRIRAADTFGVRLDTNKRVPVFCHITAADVGTLDDTRKLWHLAIRLCGGTLTIEPALDQPNQDRLTVTPFPYTLST